MNDHTKLAQSKKQPRPDDVERVAKIIDPDAWHETLPTDGLGAYWIDRRGKAREQARAVLSAIQSAETAPIDMLLFCPRCDMQHVDEPSEGWNNPPHRSHLCLECGCVWRPADVATNGVSGIETKGKADNWDAQSGDASRDAGLREALDGFGDDYITSETHHPNWVLIPTKTFDRIRAALQMGGENHG